jgi:hypothetical protein
VLCMLSCFDIYFDGFLYFTCGVSDLVGWRIAIGLLYLPDDGSQEPKHVAKHR